MSGATTTVGDLRWVLPVDFNDLEDGGIEVLMPGWMVPRWGERFRLEDGEGNRCLATFARMVVPLVALMEINWSTWEPASPQPREAA